MSKITRTLQKIFGDGAGTGEFGVIGSKSSGSPATSKDIDNIQSDPNYLLGLFGVTSDQGTSRLPYTEDMNSLFFMLTTNMKYMYQSGIPEWKDDEDYYKDVSLVVESGIVWKALEGVDLTPNTGNQPSLNLDKWTPLTLTREISTIADLKELPGIYTGQKVRVSGYHVKGDIDNIPFYYWDATSTETEDGGSIIKVTALTTGRWKWAYTGKVSPRLFGAKGDWNGATGTDDTTAVQAAFDFADSEEIDLENYSYLVNGIDTSKSNVVVKNGELVANDAVSMANKNVLTINHDNITLIDFSATVPDIDYTNKTSGVYINGRNEIKIIRGSFAGSRDGDYTNDPRSPIQIENSSNILIDGVSVFDSALEGIYSRGTTDLKVVNSRTQNTQNSGITTEQGRRITIDNNNCISTTAGANISINSPDALISNNIVEGNSFGSGITAGHPDDPIGRVVIIGNRIINSVDDGILVVFVDDAVISNNVITSCGGNGILVQNSTFGGTSEGSIVIDGNTFKGITEYAVYANINDLHDIIISNNGIKTSQGIAIRARGKTSIIGNNFTSITTVCVTAAGFHTAGSTTGVLPQLLVANNHANRCDRGFVTVSSTTIVELTGNVVLDFGSIISADSFLFCVADDQSGNPQQLPADITITGNRALYDTLINFLTVQTPTIGSPVTTRVSVLSNNLFKWTTANVFDIQSTTYCRVSIRDTRIGFDEPDGGVVIPNGSSSVTITNSNITTFSEIMFQQTNVSANKGLYGIEPGINVTGDTTADIICGTSNATGANINIGYSIL